MNDSKEKKYPPLFVGAAQADITPEYGTQIAGDIGRYRPVEEIRDRLYARIIIVKSGDNTACVIACDSDCINRDIALKLRAKIAGVIDARPDNVMIHCSQSHSAPCVGNFIEDYKKILPPELWWARGDTPAYNELFINKILEEAAKAKNAIVPAKVKFARAIDNRCAFNRRFVMRDGSGRTHPGNCDENILYCEGPIDPEASLTLFEDVSSTPIAGLLHYTCHPTHGYPQRYISADWPGLWSEIISKKLGGGCIVGCINGACGNISPVDHANPDYNRANSLDLMLKHLAQTGEKLISNLKAINEVPLKTTSPIIKIPWNRPSAEIAAKAKKLLMEHPKPIFLDDKKESIAWEWILAIRDLDRLHMLKTNPDYDFEIQAFRIGDIVVVGWPGEPFVEAQLEVKLKSKSRFLVVGHQSNGRDCGYLPTLQAIRNGGYEVTVGRKLAPDALDKITEQTIKIINGLFE